MGIRIDFSKVPDSPGLDTVARAAVRAALPELPDDSVMVVVIESTCPADGRRTQSYATNGHPTVAAALLARAIIHLDEEG